MRLLGLNLLLLFGATLAVADGVKPKAIAHRGGAASRPENTLAAFRHAIEIGVDVLEFDMNLTADNRIVIHHDSTVNTDICEPAAGSAAQGGPIRLLRLDQILQFDCGSKVLAEYPRRVTAPGARMPTLDEFLTAVRGSAALLLGETKMPPEGAAYEVPPDTFVERIHAALERHGLADRFILQSGDYRTIDEMRKRNPRIRACLLNARRYKPNYLALARRHRATHLMVRTDDVDAAGVKLLQGAGLEVFSSTANTAADWEKYLAMGMDGILTDDPEGLIDFLRQAGARR
ncbi:MAG: hypothetical protein KIT09_32685 [Bryobacteraceae bacterium]|nr:hypothetical protein [Bryobacteraceae bacterium]